jgi:hypothetical protein
VRWSLTVILQTKAEAPKGLAASRFANSADGEDNDSATAEKAVDEAAAEGETTETTEPDNSSAALASVRATLAYRSIFI